MPPIRSSKASPISAILSKVLILAFKSTDLNDTNEGYTDSFKIIFGSLLNYELGCSKFFAPKFVEGVSGSFYGGGVYVTETKSSKSSSSNGLEDYGFCGRGMPLKFGSSKFMISLGVNWLSGINLLVLCIYMI